MNPKADIRRYTMAAKPARPFSSSRFLPCIVFAVVFVGHALYIRYAAALPTVGFADNGIGDGSGLWGMEPYFQAQDYYLGFSYGLCAAFAAWNIRTFVRLRRAETAAGAAGSLTLVGVLMVGGCFVLGCCGSPILGVYMSLFGAKALGIGKPLTALVTLASVAYGNWYLLRKNTNEGCTDQCCQCNDAGQHRR